MEIIENNKERNTKGDTTTSEPIQKRQSIKIDAAFKKNLKNIEKIFKRFKGSNITLEIIHMCSDKNLIIFVNFHRG